MQLSDLMMSISNNKIPHFLILFGEEQAILDEYIKHIVKDKQVIHCDTVRNVLSQCNRKSLVNTPRVYIVSGDESFKSAEDVWENVITNFNNSKHYLILRYTSINKTIKFYTRNKQNCVEFNRLGDDVLLTYISRYLPDLGRKYAQELIFYCNHDYGRILMEIDKIKQWQEYNTDDEGMPQTDSVFKLLDKQGLFHKEIGDITFELTDAVLGGYPDTAIQKLDEAKRKDENPILIASILYNGFRNLMTYMGLGANRKDAMTRTGMTKGELWGCNKNIGGYNFEELKRNALFCQSVEVALKQGTFDADIGLDYLVLHCLK